jgi:hypothetical protein
MDPKYLRLQDASELLRLTEHILLHHAAMGQIQLCADLYAKSDHIHMVRDDPLEFPPHSMPQGVYGLYQDDDLRWIEQPDFEEVELSEVYKVEDGRAWLVDFPNGVKITKTNLVILTAEISRIKAEQVQADGGDSIKPVQRSAAQDAAIISALKTLGHDPKRLPKNAPGKPGVRSEVWAILKKNSKTFSSTKVFTNAWERADIDYLK